MIAPTRDIDWSGAPWECRTVHTRSGASQAHARLPDGQLLLTRLIKQKPTEGFPRGSLKKYFTRAKAEEEMALLKGCSLEVPE